MKRRTLDILFSVGGVFFAALLLVLGLVLRNQSNFAKSYVRDQLSEQQIVFTPAANLAKGADWKAAVLKSFNNDQAAADKFIADNKLTAEADTACLVANGGKPLASGKQAECYANKYIRLHLKDGSIFEGKSYTYATIGAVQRQLGAAVTAAKTANDTATVTATQARLDTVNAMRTTLFQGETLRGLLLTSYGFSIFGDRAMTAATVTLLGAALIMLLSIAGLIHAFLTPKTRLILEHEQPKEPVTV
jgi:hypothetical protein